VEPGRDGELGELAAPLEYRFAPAVLRIVTSPAGGLVRDRLKINLPRPKPLGLEK
jgi:hypothetical protein